MKTIHISFKFWLNHAGYYTVCELSFHSILNAAFITNIDWPHKQYYKQQILSMTFIDCSRFLSVRNLILRLFCNQNWQLCGRWLRKMVIEWVKLASVGINLKNKDRLLLGRTFLKYKQNKKLPPPNIFYTQQLHSTTDVTSDVMVRLGIYCSIRKTATVTSFQCLSPTLMV